MMDDADVRGRGRSEKPDDIDEHDDRCERTLVSSRRWMETAVRQAPGWIGPQSPSCGAQGAYQECSSSIRHGAHGSGL
jgi:hypothetical protein